MVQPIAKSARNTFAFTCTSYYFTSWLFTNYNYSPSWTLDTVFAFRSSTGVDFSDVGGLHEQIEKLKEMIVFPFRYPEVFKKFGCPRGVLFYGPPGTSQTQTPSTTLQITCLLSLSKGTMCTPPLTWGKATALNAFRRAAKIHYVYVYSPIILRKGCCSERI